MGVSTPRSPRATMIPSAAAQNRIQIRTASGFSSFAITGICAFLSASSDFTRPHVTRPTETKSPHSPLPGPIPKGQVVLVFGSHRLQVQPRSRQVDSLVLTQDAAVDNFRFDSTLRTSQHAQLDQPVGEQDPVSLAHFLRQGRICHRNQPGPSQNLFGSQPQLLPGRATEWAVCRAAGRYESSAPPNPAGWRWDGGLLRLPGAPRQPSGRVLAGFHARSSTGPRPSRLESGSGPPQGSGWLAPRCTQSWSDALISCWPSVPPEKAGCGNVQLPGDNLMHP